MYIVIVIIYIIRKPSTGIATGFCDTNRRVINGPDKQVCCFCFFLDTCIAQMYHRRILIYNCTVFTVSLARTHNPIFTLNDVNTPITTYLRTSATSFSVYIMI